MLSNVNLSDKDTRIATARREQRVPTLKHIKHVLQKIPTNSEIECRNRALIACTLLTGARDSAIASMKLKHVDLVAGCVHQGVRDVRTNLARPSVRPLLGFRSLDLRIRDCDIPPNRFLGHVPPNRE